MSIMLNEIWINKEMLPKYTYTYICVCMCINMCVCVYIYVCVCVYVSVVVCYIYIYIYMCVCVCVCVCVCIYIYMYTGWNDKSVVLKKTTLQIHFKTFLKKSIQVTWLCSRADIYSM